MVCHKRRTVKDASSSSSEIKSASPEKSDNGQLPVYQKIHSSSCCIWYNILSALTLTSFDVGWRQGIILHIGVKKTLMKQFCRRC